MGKTILQYLDHPENKVDGDVGFLERKQIVADGVIHIGKEGISVSEQALAVKKPQMFVKGREMRELIKNISYSDWKSMDNSKSTLHYLKQNAKSGKPFTMNAHVRDRIWAFYS